jgi:diguanylate cyclase (GGDEF)-like protein/PAS domain S-box-containing protein
VGPDDDKRVTEDTDVVEEQLGPSASTGLHEPLDLDLADAYSAILESLGEGLVVYDRKGEVLHHNSAAERILGPAEHLACLAGLSGGAPLVLPDGTIVEPTAAGEATVPAMRTPASDVTVTITRPSGEVRWLSVSSVSVPGRDGTGPKALVVSLRDITATRRAERRVQLGFEQAALGFGFADWTGRFTEVNPALCALLGRTKDDLLGHTLGDFVSDNADRYYTSQITSADQERHSAELQFLRPDGNEVWLSLVTTLVREIGGESYWFEQLRDVSDRKDAELALEQLALYDTLTGLPNHSLLKDRVNLALNRAEQNSARVAVVLMGIDRFSVVTDSLGHSAADAVLAQFGANLQTAVPDLTVARVGGDVFAAVVEGAGAVASTVEWAQRQFSAPGLHRFEVDGSELYITFSTGIALSGPGANAEDLLRNADVAMSRAKEAGGAKVVAFEERDLEAVRDRLALETDLRHAIAEGQIQVVYQPVVRTDNHRIIGAEALARWHRPGHGEVSPEAFVPVLAALGLAGELTSHVLRTACDQLARWKNYGKVADDFRVSVNLCAEDLTNPGLAEEVGHVLATSGLEPGLLALEVTETGLVSDTEAALKCLRDIRRLGVHLAVDDFGTGYSSLSYLNMFPVEVVKIDKSFVSGLGRDADATTLVRGVLSLTRALGLTAVAEGIEDEIQLDALRRLGCSLGQGYLWSRPVPPEEFPGGFNMPPAPDPEALLALAPPGPQVTDRDQQLGWAVLDALPTALAVIGTDGTILATNLSWKHLVVENGRVPSYHSVGANYLAVCEQSHGPRAAEATLAARGLRAVLAGERDAFTLEYDANDDGKARRFLVLISPVASRAGGAVVAHLDITERHAAEQALAESEERFHSIFDQAPLGIFRLSVDGRIVDANPALCKILGRVPQELHGALPSDLFEERVEFPESGGAHDRTEGPRYARYRARQPDGGVRVVQVNDVVAADGKGGSHTLVATVEDITERLRLAEDLRRAQEMEALGRLAGGIAHEINTPTQFISDNLTFLTIAWPAVASALAALRSLGARLRAGDAPGDIATMADELCEEADFDFIEAEVPAALSQSQEGLERVATIVRAMKAFGHPDNNDPEPTDINRLVSNTITVARNELKYVADVVTDFGDLPTVVCYQGAVGQVVLNLLVNAAYAVGKDRDTAASLGQIDVKTWVNAAHACISVTDTGPGIPPVVLPHIFEPFFTTKPLGQGTGQGLAMAWATIVERHKGRIDVITSEAGTSFVVMLPLGRLGEGPKALEPMAGASANG